MNRQTCIIIVPIYKNEFDWDEYNSVKQLFKILPIEKYDIVAICPESLDIQYYNSNFKFKEYFYFWDSYFTEYPRGYNKLLLQQGFYECFSNYEYMLVYQPDSWVFRDELEYWCNKEYDFISLRKISFFKYICSEYEDMCRAIYDMNYRLIGEDHICSFLKTSGIAFQINLPSFYEAAFFSFDMNPQILYQVTDNNRVHFELIKRYTNIEMGTGILRESYPTSKMFGIKAWTYPTIEDTINGVKNHFDIDITF